MSFGRAPRRHARVHAVTGIASGSKSLLRRRADLNRRSGFSSGSSGTNRAAQKLAPRSLEEDVEMKKFGYVFAAIGALAIAAPSIASAETVVVKHRGDYHNAWRAHAEMRDHGWHNGWRHRHADRVVIVKRHRHYD